ncbi:MAG TPA: alpha/beta hydrolase [Gammaproteobacteria bacterium]|jgi:lysophospholipase|nr:alpha/beta hydrolase [Gammaproteobacteria bacterium]MDP6731607.1 alpha/beta hydrolase [Gammaproteobacteria bacterium]HAJ76877.1 alpha/beta hydrolase [Gammaproteobacteria bacterium]
MFSRTDAEQLRESLAPINFTTDEALSGSLLEAYLDHYGLDFAASELAVSHCAGTFVTGHTNGQFELVCQYFSVALERQKGTAFLLHGYFDHAGLFGHLIKHCLRQGYAVVIFDMPGHGLSSGTVASIDSFRQYSEALIDCLTQAEKFSINQPWITIAQSTGAAVVIDALQDRRMAERFPLQRFILLGPLLYPRRWLTSKLLFKITRYFVKATPRTFGNNSHDPEFLKFLSSNDSLQSDKLQRDWILAMIDYQQRFSKAAISKQALHIIQGSGDDTVDWQFNMPQIQKKFPQSKIYMISDARHHLANESPEYRERVFSSIDQIVEGINKDL